MTRESPRKRAMVSAITVSAALFAASTAFAVANGIFGPGTADHVGSFQPITERLVPATRPRATASPPAGRPPASPEPSVDPPVNALPMTSPDDSTSPNPSAPVVTPAPTAGPVTHSTASAPSTAPEKEVSDDGSATKVAQRDD